MKKLKANPRDTSPVKHASSLQQQRSAVNIGPLQLHSSTASVDSNSFADGIDSTATGLQGSTMSGMSETIDSREEKKIEDVGAVSDRYNIIPQEIAEPTVKMTISGVSNYLQNQQHRVKAQAPRSQLHVHQPPTVANVIDPWSADPWSETFWSTSSIKDQKSSILHQSLVVETSFDTLQFQPRVHDPSNDRFIDPFDVGYGVRDLSLNDTTMTSNTTASASTEASPIVLRPLTMTTATVPQRPSFVTIQVVVHERLSILFEEDAKDPTCRVVGRIFVQPPPSIKRQHVDSFYLTVRDKKNNVEHWDDSNTRCQNITSTVPHLALSPGDQVFSVSMTENLESPVVGYTCIPRLRPMPMLLKTKVHKNSNRCRVGIRIRANPQNGHNLTDVAILMIVPLDMDGSSLTMSRKDGVWDAMKRSLTWTIQELAPGEIMDIQAQFKAMEEVPLSESLSKFPVLARCSGTTTFSRIEMHSDYTKDGSVPVDIDVQRSSTMLYRKI